MKYCSSKEIDVLIKMLVRNGWAYCRGRKHGKLLEPSGKRILTVPNSPSDYRAYMNFRRDVRQASLIYNHLHIPR